MDIVIKSLVSLPLNAVNLCQTHISIDQFRAFFAKLFLIEGQCILKISLGGIELAKSRCDNSNIAIKCSIYGVLGFAKFLSDIKA